MNDTRISPVTTTKKNDDPPIIITETTIGTGNK